MYDYYELVTQMTNVNNNLEELIGTCDDVQKMLVTMSTNLSFLCLLVLVIILFFVMTSRH